MQITCADVRYIFGEVCSRFVIQVLVCKECGECVTSVFLKTLFSLTGDIQTETHAYKLYVHVRLLRAYSAFYMILTAI